MKERSSLFREDWEERLDRDFVQRPHPIFYQIEKEAKEENVPIVSPMTGHFLKRLVEWKKIATILEFGTGLGYSTLWMFAGNPEAKLTTVDRNLQQASRIIPFLDSFLGKNKYNLKLEKRNALEFARSSLVAWEEIDLIFVDCDKITYPEFLDILWNKCRKGVTMIFDNVLWHGRPFQETEIRPSTEAIRRFQEVCRSLDPLLVPVGDGLFVLEKN